jgi:hypothetical protein
LDYKSTVKLFDAYGVLYVNETQFYFDLEDLAVIESRHWYKDKDGYLTHSYFYNGQRRFVRFHRIVMGAKPSQYIDHINKDRTDNRKGNLRFCTRSENNRNRGLYKTNKSGVTGVHYDNKRSKWVASITYNSRRLFIGRFDIEAEAIRARLKKETELFGEYAPQHKLLEVYG